VSNPRELVPIDALQLEVAMTRIFALLALLLALTFPTRGQEWSGIIVSSRAIDWSNVGVVGGLPDSNWTQCGTSIAPYGTSAAPASPSTINTQIVGCAPNTYVQLGAGTFYLSSGIVIKSHNNVAVRGMGANQTTVVFSGDDPCQGIYSVVCVESSDQNWQGVPSNGPVNWSASTYAAGTTTITLASVPNLAVGNPIILDQEDDACSSGCPSTKDTGTVFVCSDNTLPSPCSIGDNIDNGQRQWRGQVQIVTVAQCDGNSTVGHACVSGSNITISPGLYMPNWSPSKSPQAWWATNPVHYAGIENLSYDSTNANGSGIAFFNTIDSWVEGVRGIDTSRAHIFSEYSQHNTYRDSYFFGTQNSASESYGYQCFTDSDVLVENNIFEAVSGPLTLNGACEGDVIAYNYAINDYYSENAGWNNSMSNVHTVGADMVLFEGNIGVSFYPDAFHGTHNFDTYFRNFTPGTQPACYLSGSSYLTAIFGLCTNPLNSVQILSYSRFFNFVGNVWGRSGIQTTYQDVYSSPNPIGIWYIGYGDSGSHPPNGIVTVAPDPNVRATMLRWGNWDSVTNATRWCGNSSDPGWSTTCMSTSEVPSSLAGNQAAYSNPVPTNTTLPNSFYQTTAPFWWPTAKPWPLIGPDVIGGSQGICSGGTFAGALATASVQCTGGSLTSSISAGHVNSNPAEDCFLTVMAGKPNGVDMTALTFNASKCYNQSSGPQPLPPTSVNAVID
jgi:hypothetical protein